MVGREGNGTAGLRGAGYGPKPILPGAIGWAGGGGGG